jgi:hypothetical protein
VVACERPATGYNSGGEGVPSEGPLLGSGGRGGEPGLQHLNLLPETVGVADQRVENQGAVAGLTDDEVRELIAQKYDGQLAACRELLEFATAEIQTWSGRPVKRGADRIIVLEASRATKSFDAIMRLCALGFGEHAMMLNRSLFEGMAVAHWVPDNRREAVRLFTRYARYSALLWREQFNALGWLEEADLKRARSVGPKQRREFKKLFGTYGEQPWTRRSVPKLVDAIEHQWDQKGRVQLRIFHDVAHRTSNQMLHSSPFSAGAAAIGETEDALHTSIGATDQFVSQALFFAHWTYGQLFSLLIKVFRISSREAFRAVWLPGGHAFR